MIDANQISFGDYDVQLAIVARTIDIELLNSLRDVFPNKLIVVTPSINSKLFGGYEFINDNEFLDRDFFFKCCKHSRPGWLYQQFLKYHVVLKSRNSRTLIIDGDSLLNNKKFLSADALFFTNKKIEKPYNLFIESSLGKEYCLTKNFITNQMNFDKLVLKEMLSRCFGSAETFHETISDILKENPGYEFSEYQTYASWLVNVKNVRTEEIKVFRRHDLISAQNFDSLKKYDLIAFEKSHKSGFLRKIRAEIYYKFGINLG